MIDKSNRYDSLFQYYGEKYVMEWLVIKAQAIAESNLDPFAKSPVGASGLMQFMAPTWAEWWQRIHPARVLGSRTDPERSIELGTAYMQHLVVRFGDLPNAQAAYNWGWGRMKNHLQITGGSLQPDLLPAETRGYLQRIERKYGELKRLA